MALPNQSNLLSKALDEIEDHVVVIDGKGSIVFVNDKWTEFGVENGFSSSHSWLATNYLSVCEKSVAEGDSLAQQALSGIRHVIDGEKHVFCLEYPCHSSNEQRWFRLRAVPLTVDDSHFFLLTHSNITRLKYAEDLSLYDPLTGLANRRLLDINLGNEWRRCYREQSGLGVMMIDIDDFKEYNDEYGHIGGDRCICAIANVINNYTRRPGDFSARYGGDEFIIVIGGSHISECYAIADSIRHAVLQIRLGYGDKKVVTVSAGVVAGIPRTPGLDFSVIELADKCLYKSKHRGRNRIESSEF